MAQMKELSLCCVLSNILYIQKLFSEYLLAYCVLTRWVHSLSNTTFFIRQSWPLLMLIMGGTEVLVFVNVCCVNLFLLEFKAKEDSEDIIFERQLRFYTDLFFNGNKSSKKLKYSGLKQILKPNQFWCKDEKRCSFSSWKDFIHTGGTEFYRHYCVYPVAVPDRVVESMRRHARRYASFAPENCPQNRLPPNTWPNHLARAGYHYDNITHLICCFACGMQYPSHSSDCDRQLENMNFDDVEEMPPATNNDDHGDVASLTNVQLRAKTLASHRDTAAAGGTGQLFSEDACNQPSMPLPMNKPTSNAVHKAVQSFMSLLIDRTGSYSAIWRGPSVSVMADCGLYQLSKDSAKCHSCEVTFCGLTTNTCIWSLHGNTSPHCQFLRSYRGG